MRSPAEPRSSSCLSAAPISTRKDVLLGMAQHVEVALQSRVSKNQAPIKSVEPECINEVLT